MRSVEYKQAMYMGDLKSDNDGSFDLDFESIFSLIEIMLKAKDSKKSNLNGSSINDKFPPVRNTIDKLISRPKLIKALRIMHIIKRAGLDSES